MHANSDTIVNSDVKYSSLKLAIDCKDHDV